MHTPVSRPHAGQGVDVGVLDLRELPIAQDQIGQRVNGRELREHLRVRGVTALVLLLGRQLQHFEEDVGQLLGRAQVEGLAGQLVDLGREVVHLGLGCAPELFQTRHVDSSPHPLHAGEHAHQRQIDVSVGLPGAIPPQGLLQKTLEHARRRGPHGRALAVGLSSGQRGPGHRLHQGIVGIGTRGGVQHVAGQAQIETGHGEHLLVGHAGRLGGIDRIHPVHVGLHI